MQTETITPSLERSKRFATIALVIAVVIWLALMVSTKLLPEYVWLIHILMLSAEAGVVGGLADWYAITVLFRNPFGKLPIPKFLRDHTEIIPRNKARIAESMGRFVQENFLLKSYSVVLPTQISVLLQANGLLIPRTTYK